MALVENNNEYAEELLLARPSEEKRKANQKVIVDKLMLDFDGASKDYPFLRLQTEKSHQFFNGWLVIRQSLLMRIYGFFLMVLLFTERYCFLIMVYKTKCTNYVLLLLIIFSNTFVLFLQRKLQKGKPVEQKMHQILNFNNV